MGEDPTNLPDDDDLATPVSGRFRLVKVKEDDDSDDLSDEIMAKLEAIREKALEKYRETHGTA